MKRSAILSLGSATDTKTKAAWALLVAYREALAFYVGLCWSGEGRFNAETLRHLIDSPLSYRYKGQALKQAEGLVRGTRKAERETGRPATKPDVSRCGMDLSTNMLNVHDAKRPGEFDTWAKLSTLDSGHPIVLPVRKTRVYNRWAANGKLLAGGSIFARGERLYLRVTFDMPDEKPKEGRAVGLDRGVNNLLATNDGLLVGADRALEPCIERLKRTVRGSRGNVRAQKARDQFINRALKALPWSEMGVLVIENLRNIKRGKRGKLRRSTNRRFSHWTVGRMGGRIEQLCEENRVLLAEVPAAYTSQTCPACGYREKGNRHGDVFLCRRCAHAEHADIVGAKNILAIYQGRISVPLAKAS